MRENNPEASEWAPPDWMGPASAPTDTPAPADERFTLPAQEVPRDLFLGHRQTGPQTRTPTTKVPKRPRSLAFALPFVIMFGLLSAFFSWVSAEPLWLAVGHGTSGTATVTKCTGEGVTRRCIGEFTTPHFSVARVSLLGLPETAASPGKTVRAEMVSERSQRAYAGGGFMLRWLPGLILVLLFGLLIALVTGVRRLVDPRERWAALGVSVAAPLLVTIGFLAAAF